MNKEQLIQIQPSAYNLISSMRSIGYSFETALSDIIDNSISANANIIKIYLSVLSKDNFIQIIDNGIGMTNNELIDAMRLGSRNPNESRGYDDLGRFGLGLKSSSFSQCKSLTVISKKNNIISALKWDLDYIAKSDLFEVIVLDDAEISKITNINKLDEYTSGTIVMWEKFDKISISSNDVAKELTKHMEHAIEHISLVYHRYLEEYLSIYVNEMIIEAKDPFLKNHQGTQFLKKKSIYLENEQITLEPFVLPHFSKLSPKDKRLSGDISKQDKNQGFYLYRNKRLIVWGTYLGLNKKSELTKNLRIKVDIPNSLDKIWDLDIRKSQARIPSKIAKNFLSAISDGENISKNVNEYKGKKEFAKSTRIWDLITDRDGDFRLDVNKEHPIYRAFKDKLTPEQLGIFDILVKNFIDEVPIYSIYSKIGGGHDLIKEDEYKKLEKFIETTNMLKGLVGFDYKGYLMSLLNTRSSDSSGLIFNYIKQEMENM